MSEESGMTTTVIVGTGEENEDVLHDVRSKLYFFFEKVCTIFFYSYARRRTFFLFFPDNYRTSTERKFEPTCGK